VATGAQFIVSPGLVDEIALYCLDQNISFFPGTMTVGEVQLAYALGLRAVKLFLASLAGRVPILSYAPVLCLAIRASQRCSGGHLVRSCGHCKAYRRIEFSVTARLR